MLFSAVLIVACFVLRWYSSDEQRVEAGYSTRVYPALSKILRAIFGWIPFSIGDILYALAILYVPAKFTRFVRRLFSSEGREYLKKHGARQLLKLLQIGCIFYLVFNIFWGLNYNREGVARQLGLSTEAAAITDVREITELLLIKVNESRAEILSSPFRLSKRDLFRGVEEAYDSLASKYPVFSFHPASIKPSLWSWIGSYSGFTGYYNPFTGESQVNTLVPKFTQAFTACHEAAHGLGYAKEMEANFVGYLAASSSPDPRFRYSVYTDLFFYAAANLSVTDSAAAADMYKRLSPAVKVDLKERSAFYRAHRSLLQPLLGKVYSSYLRKNNQPKGMASYNEVTIFLIAFYKKFGKV